MAKQLSNKTKCAVTLKRNQWRRVLEAIDTEVAAITIDAQQRREEQGALSSAAVHLAVLGEIRQTIKERIER